MRPSLSAPADSVQQVAIRRAWKSAPLRDSSPFDFPGCLVPQFLPSVHCGPVTDNRRRQTHRVKPSLYTGVKRQDGA